MCVCVCVCVRAHARACVCVHMKSLLIVYYCISPTQVDAHLDWDASACQGAGAVTLQADRDYQAGTQVCE